VQDVLDAPVAAAPALAARPQRRWRYLVSGVSAAAVAVLALFLVRTADVPTPNPVSNPSSAGVPFVMATTADVDIISLDNQDAATVVVGQVPLAGSVVLAAAGEVELKHVQKEPDGMVPRAQMNDAGLAPMIIAPVGPIAGR
jgi:hypothetical protein